MDKELYQFIACEYYATGEGMTTCLLITRAYPKKEDYEEPFTGKLKEDHTPKVIAAREFIEEFGSWIAYGAENMPRQEFFRKYSTRIPKYVKNLFDSEETPGNFRFAQSTHINFS